MASDCFCCTINPLDKMRMELVMSRTLNLTPSVNLWLPPPSITGEERTWYGECSFPLPLSTGEGLGMGVTFTNRSCIIKSYLDRHGSR